MKVYFYINEKDFATDDFGATILRTLNDPRGWKKYGYEFIRLKTPDTSLFPDLIRVYLVDNAECLKQCGTDRLSCYRSDRNIFINHNNWLGNSLSKLDIPRYRNYVINHEFGHSLGLDHPDIDGKQCDPRRAGLPGSIMIQMSNGEKTVRPCLDNEWPLDPAEYDEFLFGKKIAPQTFMEQLISGGAAPCYKNILLIILVILIVVIIYMKSREKFSNIRINETSI